MLRRIISNWRQAKLSLGDVFYVASVAASLLGSHLVVSPTSLFQMRAMLQLWWTIPTLAILRTIGFILANVLRLLGGWKSR